MAPELLTNGWVPRSFVMLLILTLCTRRWVGSHIGDLRRRACGRVFVLRIAGTGGSSGDTSTRCVRVGSSPRYWVIRIKPHRPRLIRTWCCLGVDV
ncbi:hypothetical protein PF005_g17854 [Phytophthora fragariae]|uniref:Uncharacterized protein n=1 Tax=Phytophthora fragariae TaxID=53985 RepID=A0A6A3X2P5_9STRA|nr:hypothetical protein PF003_g15635 [Phytophthora fragariae]KAE8917294.1 hypothetical protein PF009_g32384 [Phytophthora fragariae]KAE8993357.1 hypothetical protein PF011_g17172 [Phytophthora fragariae]KAE9094343.1 hypothetical protein PF010_g17143 [Phytophthora fragariae]KAE9094450.1 hypothetical protein PF007_g17757 [Phytophthora fragariae]